jgi:hypothetical protein
VLEVRTLGIRRTISLGGTRVTDRTFAPDALDANRSGQLTPKQAETIRTSIDSKHSGITGLVAAAAERAASPRGRDLAEGRVESVEGPFRKRWWQNYGRIAGANYRFVIETREAGRQEYVCWHDMYEWAPYAGTMRLYYLPRSKVVVNVENLSTGEATPEAIKQANENYAAAREEHDKVARAEALAQLGGVAQAFEHAVPEDAASLDMHADTASLAEAIVGSWKSPFGDLTFRDDGTVSAQMGDGANFTGNWSVDAAGHLHADVMGTAMDAEAAIRGDEMTLRMDDQALVLRRQAP